MHRSPFLIQNPRSFRLAPNPAFLPKTSTEVTLSSDLEITVFYPEPTNILERGLLLMCPVRALRIYLKCTEHSHGPKPLMHRSPFLIQNPRSFRLAPNPAFLPKTSTEVTLSSDLDITIFYPEPTNILERGLLLMCPVHALHIYLKRTEHSHGPNRSLFVHWDEGRAHHPVSKRWIS